MYLVGVQLCIWALSGLYMVSLDIHAIHGDDRVKNPAYVDVQSANYPLTAVANRFPEMSGAKLVQGLEHALIQVNFRDNPYTAILLNANTGEALPQLSAEQAEKIALNMFSGISSVSKVTLLQEVPDYVPARYAPVYEVAFNTWDNLHFYIHATTGEIVTKRHSMWHIFDWMWRLHIMDYDDGENIHNLFLQIVATLSILSIIFGGILLWSRRRFTQQSLLVSKPYYKHLLVAHKYIALVVFAQLSVWLGTGLYLSLIEKQKIPLLPLTKIDWQHVIPDNVSFADLLHDKPPIIGAKLQNIFGAPYLLYTESQGYHRNFTSDKQLVDLTNGSLFNIEQKQIKAYFAFIEKPIEKITRLDEGSSDIRGEMNATWRVDTANTSYYFDARSAEQLASFDFKARIHDLMMRLHFMDYFSKGILIIVGT